MRVLLATDGSPGAESAKGVLSSLPLPPGSELLVVSVAPPGHVTPGDPSYGTSSPRRAQEQAERAAYSLAMPGVSTECLVANGHPADVICRLAEEKDVHLVVVGSLGCSALGHFLLGSVSYRVARHAPSPVLIVRPPVGPIQKLLIGIDGSKDSRRAVEVLKGFPLSPETTVIAVHVVQIAVPTFGTARGHETGGLTEEIERLRALAEVDGDKILQETAGLLSSHYSVETLVVGGATALKLLELSESMGVDLIVVGSRGLADDERFLLGGVSLQVCHHAPMSVLVVR